MLSSIGSRCSAGASSFSALIAELDQPSLLCWRVILQCFWLAALGGAAGVGMFACACLCAGVRVVGMEIGYLDRPIFPYWSRCPSNNRCCLETI